MARRAVGVVRYSLYDDLRHRSDLDSDELAAIQTVGATADLAGLN